MNSPLDYKLADGIASTGIDDGKANAMSLLMPLAIDAALDRAASDKAIVVIRGRPGMFSGGFDLKAFKRDQHEIFEMLKTGAELTERLGFRLAWLAGGRSHARSVIAMWWIFVATDLTRIPEAAQRWTDGGFANIPGEADRVAAPPWRG